MSSVTDLSPERIGRYPILRVLGSGGMGVVYVATDPSLDRQIALKTLSPRLAGDPSALARLEREARLLAVLNHPAIATIHSLEEADGVRFLTMEFVAGEDLATRLSAGPLALDPTLDIARQLASALEAAHARGLVHRDLKPANIMLTPDGAAKVLDFGLATRDDRRETSGASTPMLTQEGALLGTPGYMSPEQLCGAPVDARTDIWAYGCILYECLTGAPAFDGATTVERAAATLTHEPDLTALPSALPESIERLIERCLTKDLEERLLSMTDARQILDAEREQRSLPRTATAADRPSDTTPHNLPIALTRFIGRAQLLEEVTRALTENRLVTLTGVGGAGKTRLALEVARASLSQHAGGVWFVDLAPLTRAEDVTPRVATVLGVVGDPRRSLADTLVDHIAHKDLMLVIDNCEHVAGGVADLIRFILVRSARARILATSRQALGVTGEVLRSVPPLSVPSRFGTDPSQLLASESAQLFADRAAAVRADFRITPENATAVEQILRRLDGLPLALELAAARVRVLSVHDIAARLDRRFQLLTSAGAATVPHHQTLRTLIDWSHDQLTDAERVLLRRLSIFSGGWSLEAAEAVCADTELEGWQVLDVLTSLIDKSLVELDAEATERVRHARYRMLETIREYARERLREASEVDTQAARHRDYYLQFAEESAPRLSGPTQRECIAHMNIEYENFRVALSTCLEDPGGALKGLRLAAALSAYWDIVGRLDEARMFLSKMLERDGAQSRTPERSTALNALGNLERMAGDLPAGRRALEESLSIRRELGDRPLIAATLSNLGLYARHEQRTPEAIAYLEESLQLARETQDRRGEQRALLNLSLVRGEMLDFDRAIPCAEEALAIMRELGNTRGVAMIFILLSEFAYAQGDLERAHTHVEAALPVVREAGDARHESLALIVLARIGRRRGDLTSARTVLSRSLILARDGGYPGSVCEAMIEIAALDPAEGDSSRGARLLGAADAMIRRLSQETNPDYRRAFDECADIVRARMDAGAFDEAHRQGSAMPWDDAIALALEEAGKA
jgi:non-specific serine/threonine protein kinase